MHSAMLLTAAHSSIHVTSGWIKFLFGVLIGFVGCFFIEHRK